jgi:hypothetical protein
MNANFKSFKDEKTNCVRFLHTGIVASTLREIVVGANGDGCELNFTDGTSRWVKENFEQVIQSFYGNTQEAQSAIAQFRDLTNIRRVS